MAKKLYVGNLSYDTDNDSLKVAFEKVGPVASANVITDKFSGRSRGFGFVEMENDDDASKAIDAWDGKDLDGRTIKVNEAKPLDSGRSRG